MCFSKEPAVLDRDDQNYILHFSIHAYKDNLTQW